MPGTLNYSSNNSGGSWWLSDQNWRDLQAAGWAVAWKANDTSGFFHADEDGRWLGALATEASKHVENPDQGIAEWTMITGQSPSEEGCNCCGAPHSFSFTDDATGEESYLSYTYSAVECSWT